MDSVISTGFSLHVTNLQKRIRFRSYNEFEAKLNGCKESL